MKTLKEINEFKRKGGHPLTIDGVNIYEMAQINPSEAHRIVSRAVGEKGHRAWFNYRGRQECIAEAIAVPLPGPAGDAFCKDCVEAAGRRVSKLIPAIWVLLQALESPLIQMLKAAADKEPKAVDWTPEQMWEACHVFSADARQLYELKESQGIAAVRKTAKDEVGFKWEQAEIDIFMSGILEQAIRHAKTLVRHATAAEEKGEITFFRELNKQP